MKIKSLMKSMRGGVVEIKDDPTLGELTTVRCAAVLTALGAVEMGVGAALGAAKVVAAGKLMLIGGPIIASVAFGKAFTRGFVEQLKFEIAHRE